MLLLYIPLQSSILQHEWSGTVEIKPQLPQWEGHVVTVSDVRNKVWVALQEGAEEAGQHAGHKDLAVEVAVVAWVCLAEVEPSAP